MVSRSSLTDAQAVLVADASVIISVNATGHGIQIIRALANRVVVVDTVSGELEDGRRKNRNDADLLKKLVAGSQLEIVELDPGGEAHFEQLVVGPAQSTLDDGEAATIAHAVAINGVALIDERKANRICSGRFPELRIASTMDIFLHPSVQAELGNDGLADAVFNALCNGRMCVVPQHVSWVVSLIGAERAQLCVSLPRVARIAGTDKKQAVAASAKKGSR
jgi:predicted nucleic acid-binding protein